MVGTVLAKAHSGPVMDRARPHHDRHHLSRMLFSILGVGSVTAAALAALTLWVLMTDPATAAEVADRQSLVPVLQLFVQTLGKAIITILKFV